MNQPALDLEPTLSQLAQPVFVARSPTVASSQPELLSNVQVQRLIAEAQHMEGVSFHNVDISRKNGTGFGRAYLGQIRGAIDVVNNLTPEMLATEEGQKIVIAAAEQLFAERSFSLADMARVQQLLRAATGEMLSPQMIEELKGITLTTLEERLKRPSELASRYNSNRITQREMIELMSPSYVWKDGSGGVVSLGTAEGFTPEVKAAKAREAAYRQYLEDILQSSFDAVEIGAFLPEQTERVLAGLTALLELFDDQAKRIRSNKQKEDEQGGSIEDAARIAYVMNQIEQIMAGLLADGVVTDNSIITCFSQPGSLACYESLEKLIATVRQFKATLEGKQPSEVDIGTLGIGVASLSSFIPVEEKG
jgi:hypothetical protein